MYDSKILSNPIILSNLLFREFVNLGASYPTDLNIVYYINKQGETYQEVVPEEYELFYNPNFAELFDFHFKFKAGTMVNVLINNKMPACAIILAGKIDSYKEESYLLCDKNNIRFWCPVKFISLYTGTEKIDFPAPFNTDDVVTVYRDKLIEPSFFTEYNAVILEILDYNIFLVQEVDGTKHIVSGDFLKHCYTTSIYPTSLNYMPGSIISYLDDNDEIVLGQVVLKQDYFLRVLPFYSSSKTIIIHTSYVMSVYQE